MPPMTLPELKELLKRTKICEKFKGKTDAEAEKTLRTLQSHAHPDRFLNESEARQKEAADIFKEFAALHAASRIKPVILKSKLSEYTLGQRWVGDVSDVYAATLPGDLTPTTLVKCSRIPGTASMLKHEFDVVKELVKEANGMTYASYLPSPIETFTTKGPTGIQRVNVYAWFNGGYSLEEVKALKPEGLEPCHCIWLFKRLLTVLGFMHRVGYVHNGVLPCNVIIYPANHGVRLVDFKMANNNCSKLEAICAKYRSFYPTEVTQKWGTAAPTDLCMAAKCVEYVTDGNLPREYKAFLKAADLPPSLRPGDVWKFRDDLNAAMRPIFGKPKFVKLELKETK